MRILYPEDEQKRTAPHGDALSGGDRTPLTTETDPDSQDMSEPFPEDDKHGGPVAEYSEPYVSRAELEVSPSDAVVVYKISMAHGSKLQAYVLAVIESARSEHEIADLGVTFGYGLGAWGTEECIHIETATTRAIGSFVVALLRYFNQECAYVTVNGRPWELNHESKWSPITG